MPKEVFLEIIDKNLYFQLALFIILSFLADFVFLQLAFRFNGINVKLKNISPFIIGLIIYQLFGKHFLPVPIYGLLIIVIIAFTLWSLEKINFIKALFSSFLVMLLIGLGGVIILQPLSLYQKDLIAMDTPMGAIAGVLVELSLPAIVLFFYLTKIPPQNLNKKTSTSDILGTLLFALLFFPIYYLVILFLWISKNIPDSSLIIVLVAEIFLFVLAGLVFLYFTKTEHKKQLDQTQLQTQLDQSYRLIETLFSERREYRNQLQVMNLMATATNNKEIGDYIFQIIENMAITSIGNIKNPIIASAIISWQVQAKEKGVTIVLQCDTQLNELSSYSLRLGEIFETLLEMFIENELISKSPTQMLFLYMNETKDEYFFEFKNSEATISTFKNTPNKPAHKLHPEPLEEVAKLEHVLELIQEIGGEPTYMTQGNRLVRIKFNIKKPKHK